MAFEQGDVRQVNRTNLFPRKQRPVKVVHVLWVVLNCLFIDLSGLNKRNSCNDNNNNNNNNNNNDSVQFIKRPI